MKDKKDPSITEKDIKESIQEVIPLHRSSKEKIQALEAWVKGRARMASEEVTAEKIKNNDDRLVDFLKLEQ